MKTISHWIDGSPAAGTSDRTAPVFNPATGQERAQVALASAADVEAAVAAAARAMITHLPKSPSASPRSEVSLPLSRRTCHASLTASPAYQPM